MNLRRWPWGRLTVLLFLSGCPGTEPPAENYGPPRSEVPDGAGSDAAPNDAAPEDASTDGGGLELPLEGFFAQCGAPPTSAADFSRERLRQAAVACTSHQLCGFAAAAAALQEATEAYADSPNGDARAAAQDAFRAAMALWSRLEVMQYGPLGSMVTSAGEDMYQGQGLREQVYAWPLVSRCRVDEQVVEGDWQDEGVEAQLVSTKGLFALEYLLFADPQGPSACDASDETAQALATLSGEERAARRLAYAQALAEEVARLADRLLALYAPSGAFADSFVSGSGYPSGQEALNVLAWALIYVERELKDWKLGLPAGVTLSAPVTEPEAPLSGVSARLLEQNLQGFLMLFAGCGDAGAGIGFDDWLAEAGHAELAEEILEAHAAALSSLAALPDDLADATPAQLTAAYEATRTLTTLLKADLFGPGSPLNLALPASVEGDTD